MFCLAVIFTFLLTVSSVYFLRGDNIFNRYNREKSNSNLSQFQNSPKSSKNISEKKIVWDVGSHLGFFSALCKIKVPECKIHSFEVIPIRVQEQKSF